MKQYVGGASARRVLIGMAALLSVGALAFLAWTLTYSRSLTTLAAEAEGKLAFTTSTLGEDFVRYKLLAKALSQTEVIRRRAIYDLNTDDDAAASLLERMTAISGAADIRFTTRQTARGAAEAAAVAAAYHGVMGIAFDPIAGGAFLFAAPVRNGAAVVGAVLIRQTSAELEFAWRALPETVFFAGAEGEIRLSSVASLRLRTLHSADAPVPDPKARAWEGLTIWRFDDPAWRPLGVSYDEAVLIARPAPALEMTAYTLANAAPARADAWLAAGGVAGAGALLALLAAVVLQRRAALAARLALEERANAELELKVADRTIELTAEIEERRAVARRLRDAQEELVQAGKLAALGRMAAGIAHEINQPLAAIRNFAENAQLLMDRERTSEARANLGQIAELTDRAARIIRNLRAFARNEARETTAIQIDDAVEGALTILSARIREVDAEINWTPAQEPVFVNAGAVRLQQVIINLISNALDAQADSAAARVDLTLDLGEASVSLIIRDHGPGLSEEALKRSFEPFFSTKIESGETGLGLGLSISYGIVRSFGGDLKAHNASDGGAVFTIGLKRAEPARVAA